MMMASTRIPRRRLRLVPGMLVVGATASALLGLSTTGTLSAFTAQLNNTQDTAASGSLVMSEVGTNGTAGSCSSSTGTNGVSDCATVNKFGGATGLVPGGPASTAQITIGNTGTTAATAFTLKPTTAGTSPDFGCTSSNVGSASGSATDACSVFTLKIMSGSTVVYNGSPAGLGTIDLSAVGGSTNLIPAPGGTTPFTFTVSLPAGSGNAYQGKQVSLPMTWSFSAGS